MLVKLMSISSFNDFMLLSKKYNIFRDLYDAGSYGLEIKNINSDNADKIYQLLLKNGELCYMVKKENSHSDILTIGPISKLKENSNQVKSVVSEEIGHAIADRIRNYESYDSKILSLGSKQIEPDEIAVMGILNVTPDSFSDGGKYITTDAAVDHALSMIDYGADIIDVGGESTRPGAKPVSLNEELDRVIPVIKEIINRRPDAVISIDTTKPEVADEAARNGAAIINDISALTFDNNMIDIAVKYKLSVILMHMKGNPQTMQENPDYEDVVNEVYEFLYDRVIFARKNKIQNIIIDPGFGFGKRLQDNYKLLSKLSQFKTIGYPILAGVSRKSMLGKALNLDVDQRDAATVIAETIAVTNGARIIRTHNVKNAVKLKKIVKFVSNSEKVNNV
ncbi:MAG: dihydropteroate synthase [Melioribacteraceae bacterium]|nr:dihydropteroate synthase [Melioribacteraceae bacterium]